MSVLLKKIFNLSYNSLNSSRLLTLILEKVYFYIRMIFFMTFSVRSSEITKKMTQTLSVSQRISLSILNLCSI